MFRHSLCIHCLMGFVHSGSNFEATEMWVGVVRWSKTVFHVIKLQFFMLEYDRTSDFNVSKTIFFFEKNVICFVIHCVFTLSLYGFLSTNQPKTDFGGHFPEWKVDVHPPKPPQTDPEASSTWWDGLWGVWALVSGCTWGSNPHKTAFSACLHGFLVTFGPFCPNFGHFWGQKMVKVGE